jgi:hypothetical protein
MAERTHWAGAVADASIAREEAADGRRRVAASLQSELERAVVTESLVFMDRIEGELADIVKAFNARVGHPVLSCHRSLTGSVSLHSGADGSYVLFAPDLQVADPNHQWTIGRPGINVTTRSMGRGGMSPYRFVVHNDRLHIECGGSAAGPEQFVRVQLEPWLALLPLGGR